MVSENRMKKKVKCGILLIILLYCEILWVCIWLYSMLIYMNIVLEMKLCEIICMILFCIVMLLNMKKFRVMKFMWVIDE